MKIRPLADRVVIKNVEAEETTKSGIILTAPPRKSPRCAKLSLWARAALWTGNQVEMTVKVGDRVLIAKYAGTEVKVDGDECTIVRQSDILAVVE